MDLFFAPMSCSLATRIALYESGQDADFHRVALADKTVEDGRDYWTINPKGQVPALITDDGIVITEGPAVLQYVADRAPETRLAPAAGTTARYELQTWLNYISSEIHKYIYFTIFNPESPEEARRYAREVAAPKRYEFLARHLAGRDFLVGEDFTVADAYLTVTLNWAQPGGIDLSRWPALTDYHRRMAARPAVARAISEEAKLREAS
ncbi:MAG: glutathione transferase GstA [Rhizobiales bacterium]|nr:glutathione transferase GstA [Hyphomicrobiales bacterium]